MNQLYRRKKHKIIVKTSEKLAESTIEDKLLQKKVVFHIDIKTPTVLIPQKSDSPSLLVLNFGSLKVENMFSSTGVENILVELSSFHINRAVMTLAGGLETQEPILEPAKIRCDIKRSRIAQDKEYSEWDVDVQFGVIRINLGQRDLNTIIAVATQNKSEAQFIEASSEHSRPITPAGCVTPQSNDDENFGKLEAFLVSSGTYKLATISVCLEGATLTLYTDMDEVLSSPVRDAATALAKVELGELQTRGEMNSSRDLELRLTLDYCDVFDVRPDSENVIKKLFGQYIVKEKVNFGGVYVSSPPMLCATYKSNQNGDNAVEVTLEKTRFNISANFCLSLYKYISEALPSNKDTNGLMNPGFIGDGGSFIDAAQNQRPPSSSDSTSGYLSTVTNKSEDNRVTTVSIQIKPPEVVLFAEPDKFDSQVLVFTFETIIDFSRHPSYEDWKVHVQDISVYAATYTDKKQIPYPVLEPTNLLCTLCVRPQEDQEIANIEFSKLSLHVNPAVINILNSVSYEVRRMFELPQSITLQLPCADMEDLWTPKKLSANFWPSRGTDEMSPKIRHQNQRTEQLTLKVECFEVSFEDQTESSSVPVLKLEGRIQSELADWRGDMSSRHEIQLSLNYFNSEHSSWEPILEPIAQEDFSSRFFELTVQTMVQPAQTIGVIKRRAQNTTDKVDSVPSPSFRRGSFVPSTSQLYSGSSSETEGDCDSEMLVLKAQKPLKTNRNSMRRSNLDVSFYGEGKYYNFESGCNLKDLF